MWAEIDALMIKFPKPCFLKMAPAYLAQKNVPSTVDFRR